MFGSSILEVALGLAFVYFALSTVASHVNETIAALLKWRANDLKKGIENLLAHPDTATAVLSHSLITRLGGKAGRFPSYIPAATFTLALFDTLAQDNSFDILQVRAAIAKLPDTSSKRALLAIIDSSYGNIEAARKGVEDWFNAAMDRLSGEYKRRILLFTLLIGALISAIAGADSIALAQTLWQEQGVRDALTAAAQSAGSSQNAIDKLQSLGLPLGWNTVPSTTYDWALRVAGIAITTLAVSLGAPFWFDFLQKFMNPRSSGDPPAVKP